MEPAGPGLMAGVAHGARLAQHAGPRHSILLVAEGHGVGDDLEAIVQASVMLAADMLLRSVPKVQDSPGVLTHLSAAVDLQLHAEEAGALAVKDGLRLIVCRSRRV